MLARKVRFEDYEVDFARRELRRCGIRIGLQRKPFRVLELLLRRPGELVTREELFCFLWPDSHVGFEHGLNTAVNSLRQVLGESSRDSHFIETRPGLGYRFCASVQEVLEANSKPTSREHKNAGAYEDCLKGRYFLESMVEEDTYKAIAFFNAAGADDTCSPLAHTGLADAYCQLALFGSTRSSKLAAHARSAAEFALRSDPDLPHAHLSIARVKMLFDWDWRGAQEAVSRALEIDPSPVPAYILGASLLCTFGHYEEALQICGEALSVDPLSFSANLQFGACLYAARDFKRAIDQCWKILVLSPHFAPAQILLALAYEQLGLYEEAVVEFQNVQRCRGFQAAALSGVGHVYTAMGLRGEAEQALLELSTQAQNRYVSPYWHAVIYAGRGQKGEAIAFLEESLRQRDTALLSIGADARFDGIRMHERFQTLLRQVGISNVEDRLLSRAAST